MAAPLLHEGAAVVCPHGGRAQPLAPSSRVRASGNRIVVLPAPYAVTGCPTGCTSATFVSGATRVFASGTPVVLVESPSTSVPSGAPLRVLGDRARVLGL